MYTETKSGYSELQFGITAFGTPGGNLNPACADAENLGKALIWRNPRRFAGKTRGSIREDQRKAPDPNWNSDRTLLAPPAGIEPTTNP